MNVSGFGSIPQFFKESHSFASKQTSKLVRLFKSSAVYRLCSQFFRWVFKPISRKDLIDKSDTQKTDKLGQLLLEGSKANNPQTVPNLPKRPPHKTAPGKLDKPTQEKNDLNKSLPYIKHAEQEDERAVVDPFDQPEKDIFSIQEVKEHDENQEPLYTEDEQKHIETERRKFQELHKPVTSQAPPTDPLLPSIANLGVMLFNWTFSIEPETYEIPEDHWTNEPFELNTFLSIMKNGFGEEPESNSSLETLLGSQLLETINIPLFKLTEQILPLPDFEIDWVAPYTPEHKISPYNLPVAESVSDVIVPLVPLKDLIETASHLMDLGATIAFNVDENSTTPPVISLLLPLPGDDDTVSAVEILFGENAQKYIQKALSTYETLTHSANRAKLCWDNRSTAIANFKESASAQLTLFKNKASQAKEQLTFQQVKKTIKVEIVDKIFDSEMSEEDTFPNRKASTPSDWLSSAYEVYKMFRYGWGMQPEED